MYSFPRISLLGVQINSFGLKTVENDTLLNLVCKNYCKDNHNSRPPIGSGSGWFPLQSPPQAIHTKFLTLRANSQFISVRIKNEKNSCKFSNQINSIHANHIKRLIFSLEWGGGVPDYKKVSVNKTATPPISVTKMYLPITNQGWQFPGKYQYFSPRWEIPGNTGKYW